MNEAGDPNAPGHDARGLRNAFGMFPTGVTVVTTCGADGRPIGLTCNSFSSISLKPPLVLWSLSLYSPNLQAFLGAPCFAVNILACHQYELSLRFSSPVRDRFEGLAWTPGESGIPLLPEVAAHIECRNETRHYSGDHVILIGQVVRYRYRDVEPLVFARGLYRSLGECLGNRPPTTPG